MIARPPQRDLFVSERPVRSDMARGGDARERSYARRRVATMCVLAALIIGAVYAVWSHRAVNPADIPTIRAEGVYKQKPADPGGIDIPHQDVRVYDQLESKGAGGAQIEHLLPPAEVPREMPHAALAPVSVPAPVAELPEAAVIDVKSQIAPVTSVAPSSGDSVLSDRRPARLVETTVAPAPVPVPAAIPVPASAPVAVVAAVPVAAPAPKSTVAPKQEMTIDQVLANTKATSAATAAPDKDANSSSATTGSVAVQLASAQDEGKAQEMMRGFQAKYAAQLGGAVLHVARADLGKRGVYYRIQSQGLADSEAARICSALKQSNAGCILVRK